MPTIVAQKAVRLIRGQVWFVDPPKNKIDDPEKYEAKSGPYIVMSNVCGDPGKKIAWGLPLFNTTANEDDPNTLYIQTADGLKKRVGTNEPRTFSTEEAKVYLYTLPDEGIDAVETQFLNDSAFRLESESMIQMADNLRKQVQELRQELTEKDGIIRKLNGDLKDAQDKLKEANSQLEEWKDVQTLLTASDTKNNPQPSNPLIKNGFPSMKSVSREERFRMLGQTEQADEEVASHAVDLSIDTAPFGESVPQRIGKTAKPADKSTDPKEPKHINSLPKNASAALSTATKILGHPPRIPAKVLTKTGKERRKWEIEDIEDYSILYRKMSTDLICEVYGFTLKQAQAANGYCSRYTGGARA